MALACCVVQESIHDKFVAELKSQIKSVNCGPAWDKNTRLGPITYEKHYKEVLADIERVSMRVLTSLLTAEIRKFRQGMKTAILSVQLF